MNSLIGDLCPGSDHPSTKHLSAAWVRLAGPSHCLWGSLPISCRVGVCRMDRGHRGPVGARAGRGRDVP
jgi:hypothetical protein